MISISLMTKKLISFLVLFLILAVSSYSQVNNYKYTVAKTVYENLVTAYGISKTPPTLIIKPKGLTGRQQILMYYPGEHPKIVMDEQVYDLCVSMGKDSINALAALLGHELAHHFKDHNWCSSFSFLLGDTSRLIKEIKEADKKQKISFESQADDNGIFYSYIAGYPTNDVMPRLLESIYSHYKMPDKLPGYPSKNERIAIAKKRAEEVSKLIPIFDASEFLFCLREYSQAYSCLNFLAEKFPSREVHNDAGVCKLLNAVNYIGSDLLPFMLPIEFDPNTRLKNTGDRGGNELDEREKERIKTENIKAALLQFDKAIQRDPSYTNAKINKGCCYLLQKNNAYAIGIATELINNSNGYLNSNDLSKAHTLRAIAYWQDNKKEEAIQDFEKAKKTNDNSITRYNSEIHQQLKKSTLEAVLYFVYNYFKSDDKKILNPEKALNPNQESINGQNAKNYSSSSPSNSIRIYSDTSALINATIDKTFGRLQFLQNNYQSNFLFTKKGYSLKTAQGLLLGSSKKTLEEKYGEPSYKLNVVNGEYYIYLKSKISFLIDKKGNISKWFLFYKY